MCIRDSDPITQKDYYSLYAFFNNIPENGLDGRNGNAVPMIKTPSTEQEQKLAMLTADVKAAEKKLTAPMPEVDAAQAKWEETALDSHVKWTPLEPTQAKSAGGAALTVLADKSVLAGGANPATDTYTVTIDKPAV